MRFILTAAPDPNRAKSEVEAPPDEKLIAAYMKFNEDMHTAGVLVASEGLSPTERGARIGIVADKRTVLDGPFAETKELVIDVNDSCRSATTIFAGSSLFLPRIPPPPP